MLLLKLLLSTYLQFKTREESKRSRVWTGGKIVRYIAVGINNNFIKYNVKQCLPILK